MNLQEYLSRICYKGDLTCSAENLCLLHQCNILTVPFENVDVYKNIAISLDIKKIYQKVVVNYRGGFCYELNYLFYWLLKEIGFSVEMISSRIYNKHGQIGPDFDHMSLLICLEGDLWLVDVGYGDLFIEPLKVKDQIIVEDWFKKYKIEKINNLNYLLSVGLPKKGFVKRYQFDLRSRSIEDFEEQCLFKQYDPQSYFVENFICTLPNKRGRVTLLNNVFTQIIDGERVEQLVESLEARDGILRDTFFINC